jgi:hypothetical protein
MVSRGDVYGRVFISVGKEEMWRRSASAERKDETDNASAGAERKAKREDIARHFHRDGM